LIVVNIGCQIKDNEFIFYCIVQDNSWSF